jgi:hypothetical protein
MKSIVDTTLAMVLVESLEKYRVASLNTCQEANLIREKKKQIGESGTNTKYMDQIPNDLPLVVVELILAQVISPVAGDRVNHRTVFLSESKHVIGRISASAHVAWDDTLLELLVCAKLAPGREQDGC